MINEYNSVQSTQSTDGHEVKLCKEHDLPLQFVCCERGCRPHPLLCADCLPNHRQHPWETYRNIYQEINAISKEQPLSIDKGGSTEKEIKLMMSKFKKRIDRKTAELQQKISGKLEDIRAASGALSQRDKRIDEQNVHQILKLIQNKKSKPQNSLQLLKKFVVDSISAAETKIITVLNDIQLSIDVDWLACTPKDRKKTFQCLKTHINQEIQETPFSQEKIAFDKNLKHIGIQLSDDCSEAIYVSDKVKGPVAILNTRLSQCNKFMFQIVKLTHTAFFFPDSTIFIGVCQPAVVKSAGLRRITQSGKGAYLIGSTGWTYHHNNQLYDRKNAVGWRMSEKDKITMEVNLNQPGVIKFIKQGYFFDSEFTMPLSLTKNELSNLHPCISFEADPGAVIKVIKMNF